LKHRGRIPAGPASNWRQLNSTVDGKLIATVPLVARYHEPAFDEQMIANITEGWAAAITQCATISLLATYMIGSFIARRRL
jgi:hypothetical protein